MLHTKAAFHCLAQSRSWFNGCQSTTLTFAPRWLDVLLNEIGWSDFWILSWKLSLLRHSTVFHTLHKKMLGYYPTLGARGSAVDWGTALNVGRSRVRFPMVSLEFFIDIILPAALWPWGWLSLWQKWVPGIFPGGKGGQCVGLTTLPPSYADCLEIWDTYPPGTLRACPGL